MRCWNPTEQPEGETSGPPRPPLLSPGTRRKLALLARHSGRQVYRTLLSCTTRFLFLLIVRRLLERQERPESPRRPR